MHNQVQLVVRCVDTLRGSRDRIAPLVRSHVGANSSVAQPYYKDCPTLNRLSSLWLCFRLSGVNGSEKNKSNKQKLIQNEIQERHGKQNRHKIRKQKKEKKKDALDKTTTPCVHSSYRGNWLSTKKKYLSHFPSFSRPVLTNLKGGRFVLHRLPHIPNAVHPVELPSAFFLRLRNGRVRDRARHLHAAVL